jgi:hypothetical protein
MEEGGVDHVRSLRHTAARTRSQIADPTMGQYADDPKQTRAALDRMRQLLVDVRDRIQAEIARGATEAQTVATVTLQQYEKMPQFARTREAVVRRIYQELKGTLP